MNRMEIGFDRNEDQLASEMLGFEYTVTKVQYIHTYLHSYFSSSKPFHP